ncbi:hypothetical protein [Pedobacter sp. P26]|uniref:hypothetical protein n=1 Tax=Pedobacter sp. P26 TaxID=3423956 RepID=UPI003D6747C2
MNVLKIRKELQLIVLLSGLLLTAFSASAQDFTNDQKILADYQKSVDSLLTKTKSVTATAALAVLKAPSITLEINLAKDTKKALSPNALYEFAKKSILIVGCSYLCPKCSNTHLSESTGYVIDAKGIVVTNYHVVNTYADMHDGFKPVAFTVRLANGHVYAVKSILTASKKMIWPFYNWKPMEICCLPFLLQNLQMLVIRFLYSDIQRECIIFSARVT